MKKKFILILLGSILLTSTVVCAETVFWNALGGNWNTAANWTPIEVPTSWDDVVLGVGGIYTIMVDSDVTIKSLTISSDGDNTLLLNTGTFTLTTPTPDTESPSVPTNLSATADSSSQISLSWTASTDNVGVASYKIYRDGTYLKSVESAPSLDMGLSASTQYCYTIAAYDAAGNESAESNQSCATTKAMWASTTIDETCDVGRRPVIAVDKNNIAHIVYFDSTNEAVKYATNSIGTWSTTSLNPATGKFICSGGDSCRDGVEPSMVLDANDTVHISYIVAAWSANHNMYNTLMYVTKKSDGWSTQSLSSTSYLSPFSSIATDQNNKVHIGYTYASGSCSFGSCWYNYVIRYGTYSSGNWVVESVVSSGTSSFDVDLSMILGLNDVPHIAYTRMSGDLLKYATSSSGIWTTSTIESSTAYYPSFAVDSNNKLHVSYYDGKDLKYATDQTGSWVSFVVSAAPSYHRSSIAVDKHDNLHILNGTSYITNASGVWKSSTFASVNSSMIRESNRSLAVDSTGKVHIVYSQLNSTTNKLELKYAVQQ